jgi:hypothetical protein
MKAEIRTNREETRIDQEEMAARLEAKIEDKNEMSEVLRGTLVSRMDIHQSRTEATQEKTDANLKEMRAGQEHAIEETMADLQTQTCCLASHTDVSQEKRMPG